MLRGQGAAVAEAALYVRYGCINCNGKTVLGATSMPSWAGVSAERDLQALVAYLKTLK